MTEEYYTYVIALKYLESCNEIIDDKNRKFGK